MIIFNMEEHWLDRIWTRIKAKKNIIIKKIDDDTEIIKSFNDYDFAVKCKAGDLKQMKGGKENNGKRGSFGG
jgi:hypothetical protein